MGNTILTTTGKLQRKFLPAVYFDSSVLIDYWMTEGMEMPGTIKKNESVLDELQRIVKDILRSEIRIRKVIEIRKKLVYSKVKVIPVISPLSLLELMEWQAESAFKQIASEASGTAFVQKKSKKQIGNYLKKALELRKAEVRRKKIKKRDLLTSLEILMEETWLNSSFAQAHGLQGLLQVDIMHFHLPITQAWAEPSAYAYLQLGVSDILHILLAQHLGYKYLASFDSDFKRVKGIVKEETGMIVLNSPEEILDIL
jgi:predicted nucleic acid-binding protein